MIGGALTPCGAGLVVLCQLVVGPELAVVDAAVVTVGVETVVVDWAVGLEEVADPVDVVSFVAVVFGAGLTTTGGLDNTRPAPQERILFLPPGATLRSSATGGRQPGIAPRTARPRTRRT
jgi:hypothetical protein